MQASGVGRAFAALVVMFAVGACGGGGDGPSDGGPPDTDGGSGEDTLCERNSDCDDGLYCNGAEICDPADTASSARGCVPGVPPCAASACAEATDDCGCGVNADRDGDGDPSIACGGGDCDDDDARRASTLTELCDAAGLDEDCQRDTLAGPADGDVDGDGYVSALCCGPNGAGGTICGSDCDDGANSVNIGTPESCNGTDDDCDGQTDEGVVATFYLDDDGDLHGDPEVSITGCTAPSDYVTVGNDCDDSDGDVNPNADETCNEIDDDCDAVTDEDADELGTLEHCSACGDNCQFRCDAGTCDEPVQLSVGHTTSCTVTGSGRTYCWGSNVRGMLGTGTAVVTGRPVEAIGVPRPARSVSVGVLHACGAAVGLGADRLYCWGWNADGQVGNGETESEVVDPYPAVFSNLLAGAAFGTHSCRLGSLPDGGSRFSCWGDNGNGQLGTGDLAPLNSPPSTSILDDVADFDGYQRHTCARTTAGAVYCWGLNDFGRTGVGVDTGNTLVPTEITGLSGVRKVTTGGAHSCALLDDGTVSCWGAGLVVGSSATLPECTSASGPGPCATSPVPVTGLSSVVDVAAGSSHTCAVLGDGTVRCWGLNFSGCLGDGTTDHSVTPVNVVGLTDAVAVSAGYRFTCVRRSTGHISCWGLNSAAQIGDDTLEDRYVPTPLLPPLP